VSSAIYLIETRHPYADEWRPFGTCNEEDVEGTMKSARRRLPRHDIRANLYIDRDPPEDLEFGNEDSL
jgi:hypothetical protein